MGAPSLLGFVEHGQRGLALGATRGLRDAQVDQPVAILHLRVRRVRPTAHGASNAGTISIRLVSWQWGAGRHRTSRTIGRRDGRRAVVLLRGTSETAALVRVRARARWTGRRARGVWVTGTTRVCARWQRVTRREAVAQARPVTAARPHRIRARACGAPELARSERRRSDGRIELGQRVHVDGGPATLAAGLAVVTGGHTNAICVDGARLIVVRGGDCTGARGLLAAVAGRSLCRRVG
jgi:hypothetical protein